MSHEGKQPVSKIVLVGHGSARPPVRRAMAGLELGFDSLGWAQNPLEVVDTDTVAVLLTPAPRGRRPHRLVTAWRRALPDRVAVVVLVPDGATARTVRRLYQAGAATVLEWPRESSSLAPVLSHALALRFVRGPAKRSDQALARVVKAHLKATGPDASGIDVDSRAGVVTLRGAVRALWRKQQLERCVAEVPGVTGVDAHELMVSRTELPDRAVRTAVRRVLAALTEHTVAASVSHGHVSLAGTVPSRAEARRLQEVLAQVRGVRSLENLVVVSSTGADDDRALAVRVRKALARRFPQLDLEVRAFGKTVVLSGSVQTLATKWDVCAAVERIDGVRRLVDKVAVASRPRA